MRSYGSLAVSTVQHNCLTSSRTTLLSKMKHKVQRNQNVTSQYGDTGFQEDSQILYKFFFFQVDSSIYLLDQVFQAQPGGDPGLDWDTLKRLCLSDGFGTPHCLPRRAASHWGDRGPCLDCCTYHSDSA